MELFNSDNSNFALQNKNWWQNAVIYQIYPRSFFLAEPEKRNQRLSKSNPYRSIIHPNDDVSGDLAGITAKLEYLKWLGVNAIWISPIYPSPMADFGYDVSNYVDIDPLFGTLADLDLLVDSAHKEGIRVVLDWVPNHTSSMHPWFLDAKTSKTSRYRDFYIWKDKKPDGSLPNNWLSAFLNAPAWTFDENTEQCYLHLFLKEQPDLNWNNPEVVEEMDKVLRFYLDRGVDGFRIDVVHCVGKDDLDDTKEMWSWAPRVVVHESKKSHELINHWRQLISSYDHSPMIVGEVALPLVNQIAKYYGEKDELSLAFMFPLMHSGLSAQAWFNVIKEIETEILSKGNYPSWVLSNHDVSRHGSRYGMSIERMRLAAILILTLPGTVFLYQGEELGLTDAVVDKDHKVDPGNRDGERAPIPWEPEFPHGWNIDKDPWLPFPPNPQMNNVSTELNDTNSILHLYQNLISFKQTMLNNDFEFEIFSPLDNDVLQFTLSNENSSFCVLGNFERNPVSVENYLNSKVLFSSDPSRDTSLMFSGELNQYEGLILKIN